MSKAVLDRLPAEIISAFDGDDLERKIGRAYLLLTPDPDGTPRPCLLSAGEILAPDDRMLRVALWPGTLTSQNLARCVATLLCFIVPGQVFYVKGRARPLGRDEHAALERFEITVDSVESDVHPGMPVSQGIGFSIQAMNPSSVVELWQRQLAALRHP